MTLTMLAPMASRMSIAEAAIVRAGHDDDPAADAGQRPDQARRDTDEEDPELSADGHLDRAAGRRGSTLPRDTIYGEAQGYQRWLESATIEAQARVSAHRTRRQTKSDSLVRAAPVQRTQDATAASEGGEPGEVGLAPLLGRLDLVERVQVDASDVGDRVEQEGTRAASRPSGR